MDPSRDLAAWTDLARRELVDLVAITSFSDEEHEAVDHLVARCAELGLPASRQPVEGSADNLLVGWSERPELLLTAHVDTIRPTWDWDGTVEVRGDLVVGLGAQDDKGCVVAALLALLMAQDAGVPVASLPVAVGLCVDEERGGKGSLAMATALRPRFVVGLEGTELGAGLAEGGFVEVWIHVKGTAVHGALRELGDNAIEKALSLVAEIQAHPGSAYEHPLLGRNIPMVWEIRGGQPLNVVPDACSVHLDWRVTPGRPVLGRAVRLAGGGGRPRGRRRGGRRGRGAVRDEARRRPRRGARRSGPADDRRRAGRDRHDRVDRRAQLRGSRRVAGRGVRPGSPPERAPARRVRVAHRRRDVRAFARRADRGHPCAARGGRMSARYDAVIVGGGHNGLVAAFYLARGGLRTLVLERRDIVGGACVTEEFAPGFRASPGAYVLSMLRDAIWHDMRLRERGLHVDQAGPSLNVFPDGQTFVLHGDRARSVEAIRPLSAARRPRVPRVRGDARTDRRRR